MVKVITLVGAGNSAHVLAGLIDSNTNGGWEVRLLTRNPKIWTNMNPTVVIAQDNSTRTGKISKVSSVPADVVPGSDIVLWTGPVNSTGTVFESVKPFVDNKKTVISTIFGQGLSHLLATRVFGADVRYVAMRNIPWLCRCTKKGHSSEIVGAKGAIEAACINVDQKWVTENLEPLVKTQFGPVINVITDFCPIVFNPANQIIHPSVYWGLFRKWNGVDPLPALPNDGWLYRGMDAVSGGVLAALDEELQGIKNAYFAKFPKMVGCKAVLPLQERIVKQYGSQVADPTTMHGAVGTNKAYSMAKTPHVKVGNGVAPHPTHRVVSDDIGWGLCVLVSIAERLNVPTTTMKWLIEWHQKFMNKEFLVNGKLTGKDCKELILLDPSEPLELVGAVASRSAL